MSETRTAEASILSWVSPDKTIGLAIWWLTTGEFQLRETWAYPGAPTPEVFPGTDAGLAEARSIARARAELIRYDQTGEIR